MISLSALGTAFFQLPLAGLLLTMAAYEIAVAAVRRLGSPSWANPVLGAIVLVGAVLRLTRASYAEYFESARFIHLLLGPAVVALAIPLHKNLDLICRSIAPSAAPRPP